METLKILVACEREGRVRDELENMGHDAWSCDLEPTESEQTRKSGKHLQCDVLTVLHWGWDIMIGFPYCTYSTNSGVLHLSGIFNDPTFANPERWRLMHIGVKFFNALWNAPIEKIVLENPIPHKYALRKMDSHYHQIIHPWMFGHMEKKQTCLWLKNLPPLMETENVYEAMLKLPKKQQNRIHNILPGADRSRIRSMTYSNIAKAMAKQWTA